MVQPLPSWLSTVSLPWVSEESSIFGQGPLLVADVAEAEKLAACRAELGNAIVVGVDQTGAVPPANELFDILLTTAPAPPRPWVHVPSLTDGLDDLRDAVKANPYAATTLAQVLRAQVGASFETALQIESFAYSTLLSGAEFRRWRESTPRTATTDPCGDPVVMSREGDVLRITLARPGNENAMTAAMRDALVEAFRVARMDEAAIVEIRGEGRVFSQGGLRDEFGTADDLAQAHHIRTVRSVALALHRLGPRSRVVIQGAAIGSGIEFAAAGHELIAHPATFFRLPEVAMGLIPGAGGTATVARRIGRQRTCYMTLTGSRLRARTALAWGLVDRLDDA